MNDLEPTPPSAVDAEKAKTLHEYALAFPETVLEHPWGHNAYKVNKKVFLFLSCDGDGLRLSLKLPDSNFEALLLPFTEPTGYGLGKSGWVSASFSPDSKPPMVTLLDWVLESYRAIAPKRALKQLDGQPSAVSSKQASTKRSTRSKAAKKKTARKATTKRAKNTAKKPTTKKPSR